MTHTRITKALVPDDAISDSAAILKLAQSAREGKVLGIGLCVLDPSGCYDVANSVGFMLHNIPVIRVFAACDARGQIQSYTFLDTPKTNTVCDTVFFAGCNIKFSSITSILNFLSEKYQFTHIKHIYQIAPAHVANMPSHQLLSEGTALSFKNTQYQYASLYSGMDTSDPSNIGMPRLELTPSEFKVPEECYGLIRHRCIDNFLPSAQDNKCSSEVEKYLNEYFRQVADAGRNRLTSKPVKVIALGILSTHRKRIVEIAGEYAIDLDFCDQYPDQRLPQKYFFQILSAMKDRNGVVSFDGTCLQSLLQAFSFNAPVIVYNPLEQLPDSYDQLINLIPVEYKPVARVIFGLSDDYALFNDREKCQKVYELLHLEVMKAHQKFDDIKNNTLSLPPKTDQDETSIVEQSEVYAVAAFSESESVKNDLKPKPFSISSWWGNIFPPKASQKNPFSPEKREAAKGTLDYEVTSIHLFR